jgi:molecular chaperone DnaK (HSP70)
MKLGIDFGTCYSSAAKPLAMKTVSIELPESVFSALRKDPDEFAREMRIAAAVKWYEIGEISPGKAAENSRQRDPQRYRREFKRDLGSPAPTLWAIAYREKHELEALAVR